MEFGEVWEKELIYKYKETMSLKDTANHCKVDISIARKYLTKLSSEYQKKYSKDRNSKDQVEEMINTFKITKSIRKTSELLGIGRSTIKKYIPRDVINSTKYYYQNEEEKIRVYKLKVIESINLLENPLRTEIREMIGTLATLKALPAYRETSVTVERIIQDKLKNESRF